MEWHVGRWADGVIGLGTPHGAPGGLHLLAIESVSSMEYGWLAATMTHNTQAYDLGIIRVVQGGFPAASDGEFKLGAPSTLVTRGYVLTASVADEIAIASRLSISQSSFYNHATSNAAC